MKWLVMVGGSRHGTCCAANVLPGVYEAETLLTRNPANTISRTTVAVHRDLLEHRKLPAASIMYQAAEDALNAYILDALCRVVGRE